MSPPAFPDGDEGFFYTESVIKCQNALLLSRFSCERYGKGKSVLAEAGLMDFWNPGWQASH